LLNGLFLIIGGIASFSFLFQTYSIFNSMIQIVIAFFSFVLVVCGFLHLNQESKEDYE